MVTADSMLMVLQTEPLLSKIRSLGLDIFQFLKSANDHLLEELSLSYIEVPFSCILHDFFLLEFFKDQEEGVVTTDSEILVKIAESLSLRTNQEILLEAVALEKLKEIADQAEKGIVANGQGIDIARISLTGSEESAAHSEERLIDSIASPSRMEEVSESVVAADEFPLSMRSHGRSASAANASSPRRSYGDDAREIPVLVEVVELDSARGKENATAALLQLCTNSNRFCNMVLQEGVVPPLVALSQSGTPRAIEKA
ncbi:unnamed protein product [Linum tenue]|nr:unnamed protein product [Linum tenue]